MKYISSIVIIILLHGVLRLPLKAQNLVPNYSFEQLDSCPPWSGCFGGYVSLWFDPMLAFGGPDYFNSCAAPPPPDISTSIPFNTLGYQDARTGNAYAGLTAYYIGNDIREYIEVELTDSLRQDKYYCAGFYVSNPECLYPVIYGIDRLGMYFSNDSLIQTAPPWTVIPVTPQIENMAGNIIYDTANWVLISGVFVANGGEHFLTIGNFRNDSNTIYEVMSYPRPSFCSTSIVANLGYYFIDDVFVYELPSDSTTCFDGVDISEIHNDKEILVYPNPASNELIVRSSEFGGKAEITIYNLMGERVFQSTFQQINNSTIDLSSYPNGIYFLFIKNKEKISSKKFMISR